MAEAEDSNSVVTEHIRNWCREKGTELFQDQLLKLLDHDYLRSWPGLANIPFPEDSVDGSILNYHWRYRFYRGCATVLGWPERVTYGDPRYFHKELHVALKQFWPDDKSRDSSLSVDVVLGSKRSSETCNPYQNARLLVVRLCRSFQSLSKIRNPLHAV
ncbi:hypothetical protein R1sor_014547 [Riccia sorocarpa]|uniref:Uncharacterized protein n=1 Tax=Riccia sorocarpa TaxID=122646 RepID=A0ABD3HA76_9MARC